MAVQSKTIRGRRFSLEPLRLQEAIPCFVRWGRTFAPWLHLVRGLSENAEEALPGQLVAMLCSTLQDNDLQEMSGKMLFALTENGQPTSQDTLFSGNFGLLIEVLAWAGEVHFGPFVAPSSSFLPSVERLPESPATP